MILEEIKAALKAKGYEAEPTPEILRQWGWEPSDPLKGVEIGAPVRNADQMRDDFALLLDEAKANNVSAQIRNGIVKLAGIALKGVAGF
jgi:hypothetical protein